MTVIGPAVSDFGPDHADISYTDHSGVDVTEVRAQFQRPVTNDTLTYCGAGARVRFRTNSPIVTIRLGYNGLLADSYDDSLSILVNGEATDYEPGDHLANFEIELEFDDADYRNIEIISPFGTGLDFKGVTIDPAYDFRPCLDRPSTKLLAVGDSITQGALGSKARLGFVHLLGEALRVQTINMGFAGARTDYFDDGAWAEDLDPDVVMVMLGVNDFGDQTSEGTFKSQYTTLLNGLLASTTAPILVITPLWTNNSETTPISTYRTWISELVAAIGNGRLSTTNGLALAGNSTDYFPDGLHPNDAGAAAIASNLTPIVSALL